MAWSPQEDYLLQTLTVLKEAQLPNTERQNNVLQILEELNKLPDFNNYLIFILTKLKIGDDGTRCASGVILKNNIQTQYSAELFHVSNYIKQECLSALADPLYTIRSIVGLVISTIICNEGFINWPELLPILYAMLDSNDLNVVDGAFGALQKICEDSVEMLEENSKPSIILIPKLLQFFSHPIPKIRSYAIDCVNQFLMNKNKVLIFNIDEYLENLFNAANDFDSEVRKNICRGLALLLEVEINKLMPYMDKIIEYILLNTQDTDESVVIQASEFWLSLVEHPMCHGILTSYLPRLLPLLLTNMKYSRIDIIYMNGDEDDNSMVPDKNEDIKPRFHKSRTHIENYVINDEDDDSDDDNGDDNWISNQNLRKCSAATLDTLASTFKADLLPVFMPLMKPYLFHDDWMVKETGILALGAISSSGLSSHIEDFFPFLIHSLNDNKALVRSITCWTLSRYTNWTVLQPPDMYLNIILTELLKRILDNNKGVQEAACSAFAILEEKVSINILLPFMCSIVETFVQAFAKYQRKNLLILYDAIGTLAVSVGQYLNNPVYVDMLMPALINKWNKLQDDDKNLFPLFECLSNVAVALQIGFLPYCEPVFATCISLIEVTINKNNVYIQDEEHLEAVDKDFIVVSLDLLSGLAEGLKEDIGNPVANSNIMELLHICMVDTESNVRQSAFALLGDLVKSCFQYVQPYIPKFLPIIAENLVQSIVYCSVSNNAMWAMGEIFVKLGPASKQYIPLVLPAVLETIQTTNIPNALLNNTAVTLGKMGYVCPCEIAPHLQQFIRPWCALLRNLEDNDEKDIAYRGLCYLVSVNPMGTVPDFVYFCDAVASWIYPKDDLKDVISSLLYGFKNQVGDENWKTFSGQLPLTLNERLSVLYAI